jgi:hypothetical protein
MAGDDGGDWFFYRKNLRHPEKHWQQIRVGTCELVSESARTAAASAPWIFRYSNEV